jgi:hypothetical protein
MRKIIDLSKYSTFFMVLGLFAACDYRPAPTTEGRERKDNIANNPPGPDEHDMVLVLEFAKNDPQSLAQALEKGTEQIKQLETNLNQVLAKMAKSYPKDSGTRQIIDLRLKSKPSFTFVTGFESDAVSNFDPTSFQSIEFSYDEQRIRPDGSSSRSGEFSLFTRKLVWPDLAQQKILKLKSQHNDLVFAAPDTQVIAPLIAWKIEIPYREILANLLSNDAIWIYKDTKTGKRFWKELHSNKSAGSPPKDYCQNIPELLTQFIDADFSDLGKATFIACSSIDKTEIQKGYIEGMSHISNNYNLNLKFKIGKKPLSFVVSKGPRPGAFFDIVLQQLLLMRYDMLLER